MAAGQRWDENFEKARRFRGEHGRWPKQREGALGGWCTTQRQAKKGKGHCRISPVQIAKLDGIGFDWGKPKTSEETAGPVGSAAELQQQKKAVPPRKRVHKADEVERSATRHATEPMAAAAAFWSATPVVVAPDAGNAAAPSAGAPVVLEGAGQRTPLRATTFEDGGVIKFNF